MLFFSKNLPFFWHFWRKSRPFLKLWSESEKRINERLNVPKMLNEMANLKTLTEGLLASERIKNKIRKD